MSTFTLDDLIDNTDDGFEMSNQGAAKSDKPFFNYGESYEVTITAVEPKASKGGYLQAEVALQLSNGKKAGRQWLMLPVFTKEMANGMDQEKLNALKQSFGKRFHGFLRAYNPEMFSVYADMDKSGKKWKFFDSDGNEMTAAQKKVREGEVSAAVMKASADIATGNIPEGLIGATLYLVVTQDKKDAKRTYLNWYSEEPTNYPAASVE